MHRRIVRYFLKETKTELNYRDIELVAGILSYLPEGRTNDYILEGDKPLSYSQVRRMCNRIRKDNITWEPEINETVCAVEKKILKCARTDDLTNKHTWQDVVEAYWCIIATPSVFKHRHIVQSHGYLKRYCVSCLRFL